MGRNSGIKSSPIAMGLLALMSLSSPASADQSAPRTIPEFSAKALSGPNRTREDLLGRPTFLIVNPSEQAGDKSKAWAESIRRDFGSDVRQKTIIAVDVPFFVTEYMALGQAKRSVPERYWERTWLMKNTDFEESLGIPSKSPDPRVFVLDANGKIVAQVEGKVSPEKMGRLEDVWSALEKNERAPASRK